MRKPNITGSHTTQQLVINSLLISVFIISMIISAADARSARHLHHHHHHAGHNPRRSPSAHHMHPPPSHEKSVEVQVNLRGKQTTTPKHDALVDEDYICSPGCSRNPHH